MQPIGPRSTMDSPFELALDRIPSGHSEGAFGGDPYGITKTVSADGRRLRLYAESRSSNDVVSFNLYRTASGALLKPCEMPRAKVVNFVIGVSLAQ